MKTVRRPLSNASPLILLALAAANAHAAEFVVPDRDPVALQAALLAANASPDADVIRLAPDGLYTLAEGANERFLLPPINGTLVIEGQGAELRGYANGRHRVLAVAEDADVTVRDLTLAEGSDGAVRNDGRLDLERVTITDSTAATVAAIVLNHGTLTLNDSRIAFNSLPIAARDAGTVVNYGRLEVTHSEIHENLALGANRHVATAGAVLNFGELRANAMSVHDNAIGEEAGPLAFPGVLNLGNGRVTGDLAAESILDASRDPQLAAR